MSRSSSARALLLAVLFGAAVFQVQAASSCVDCHGNEATMKALVPPPAATAAEGEG
jgi:mono/diheme cytochrome c family protein